MSIPTGLASEAVFNAVLPTQVVFQRPAKAPPTKNAHEGAFFVLASGGGQRGSLNKPLTIDTQPTSNTMVNGRPVDTAMANTKNAPSGAFFVGGALAGR